MSGEHRPPGEVYRQPSGVIVICMYCRRALRPGSGGGTWELVEEFRNDAPPGVSHGLCGDCMELHHPKPE